MCFYTGPSAACYILHAPPAHRSLVTHSCGLGCLQVVQTLGASEGDTLALLTGASPKAVEGDGAINVVNAAKAVGVTQYVMVTSMGTGKFGWPASESFLPPALPDCCSKNKAAKSLGRWHMDHVPAA